MKVRVNSLYRFEAVSWDLVNGANLEGKIKDGDVVRVKNVYGCPNANVMGNCYIFSYPTNEFIGMVSTSSLHGLEPVVDRNTLPF